MPHRIVNQSKDKKDSEKDKIIKNSKKVGPFSKIKNKWTI